MDPGRRAVLVGLAGGAGAVIARGLGAGGLFAPDAHALSHAEALRALGASLSPVQRDLVVFPADHPSRQMVYTASVLERPHVGTLFSPAQRELVVRLYETMLSERGRRDFAPTVAVEGRLDGCTLALYGEPSTGDAHVVLAGGHLMLRGGGPADAALESGVAYGHQTGNERWRVPGNSFAPHGDAANGLYAALDAGARRRAILPSPPHELVLQPQDAGGRFPGVRVGSLGESGREEARNLLEAVLSPFPESARSRARAAIGGHGGIDELHVAYYASHGFYEDMRPWDALDAAERERRGDPYWQVWRIEGPGTVVHFKGHPHVHSYVRVVSDPARANVGPSLGHAARPIEGETLRRLVEDALSRASGEPLAFYGDDVPGRFCPGEVTAGLAWALDPYRSRVVVATVDARAMAAPLRDRLVARGVDAASGTLRVATTGYFAGREDAVGSPEEVVDTGVRLRDALVEHLRAGALEEFAST